MAITVIESMSSGVERTDPIEMIWGPVLWHSG